jgi:hypothetical protein
MGWTENSNAAINGNEKVKVERGNNFVKMIKTRKEFAAWNSMFTR